MASMGKGLVEVGISMVLKDNFTTNAGKISSSYVSLMNDLNQYNRALTNGMSTVFDTGMSMSRGIVGAYKHFADINNQVFMTSKIAGASAAQQLDIMKAVKKINEETPLTNLDISSGAKYLAMAGNNADQIQAMLDPAAKLASIFDMSLGGKGGVADLMTNIMATFNIPSDQAQHVADVLGVATTSANMNLQDLAQSLQYAGADFRNAGIDLSTAAAAIGVLGDQGIQASSAGTALANMVRYLTLSITGRDVQGAKMLQRLGISREDLVDAQGNLKDLGTVMQVMYSRISKVQNIDKTGVMKDIFKVRGQRAASALLQAIGNGSDKLAVILQKEREADGWVEDIIGQKRETAQGRIDTLTASIENLTTTLGSITQGPLNMMITSITKIVQWFDHLIQNPMASWVVQFTAISIMTGTVVNGIRLVRSTFSMIVGISSAVRGNTSGMATGISRTVAGAQALEAHLRTIVALMSEFVAMNMAPGTSMALPLGGRLGKGKTGKVFTSLGKTHGGTAWYANQMAAAAGMAGSTGAAAARAAAGTTGTQALSRWGRIRGMAGAAGGTALAFMGGPWGLGAAALLTLGPMLYDAIKGNTDAEEENTRAVNANTMGMTAQQYQQWYSKIFAEALKEAISNGKNKDPNRINININGQPVEVPLNDNIDINNLLGI